MSETQAPVTTDVKRVNGMSLDIFKYLNERESTAEEARAALQQCLDAIDEAEPT